MIINHKNIWELSLGVNPGLLLFGLFNHEIDFYKKAYTN